MDEIPVDTTNRLNLILPGIICLAVGLMFFVPGILLGKSFIFGYLHINDMPDGRYAIITLIMLALGAILLLLSYQFFTGKVGKQHISTPILVMVSIGFITLSTAIVISSFFLKSAPSGYRTGKAIGGGAAIGCLGLYFAYKRKRGASNQRSDHDRA